jgi:DNA polymerase III delta prime subunit
MLEGVSIMNWAVKYRPTSLEEMILPDSQMNYLIKWRDGSNRQSLVFYGKPGNGKTLSSELMAGDERVYLDCRDYQIGDRLNALARSGCNVTLNGVRRVIVIDDCENLSKPALINLRGLIDRTISINDFILTTNRIDRLDDPLKSRLQLIGFDNDLTEDILSKIKFRLDLICAKEGLEPLSDSGVNYLIKRHYPDLRKIIGSLQMEISKAYI